MQFWSVTSKSEVQQGLDDNLQTEKLLNVFKWKQMIQFCGLNIYSMSAYIYGQAFNI